MITAEVRASLRGVETAWDALAHDSPLPSPFLRSWWLDAVSGPRPRFVLAFDGDRLVGGIALEEDRILGVERLRAVGFRLAADHLDLVADPEHVDEVVVALRQWFARPGARVIDLVGLAERARVVAALPSPVCTVFDTAPWSPLPASFDDYFDQQPPLLRRQVERPRSRLERAGVEYRRVEAGDIHPALERLRRLHEARWGKRSEFLPTFDVFARAARAGISRGELLVSELWVDDAVVATLVCFDVAGRLSYYQGGHDGDRRWRGAGTLLMALVVGDACRRGSREFDLLRGAEPYKDQWASGVRALLHAGAVRGWRGRLVASLLPAAQRAKVAMNRMHLLRKTSR